MFVEVLGGILLLIVGRSVRAEVVFNEEPVILRAGNKKVKTRHTKFVVTSWYVHPSFCCSESQR